MNITIIGGDSRIEELVKFLSQDQNEICLYGLENSEKLKYLKHLDTMESALENSDLVITSIPISKDGKYINTPLSDKKISVQEFFETVKNLKII